MDTGQGYRFRGRMAITHLLNMDDIMLPGVQTMTYNSLIHLIRTYNVDIGMTFRLDRRGKLHCGKERDGHILDI